MPTLQHIRQPANSSLCGQTCVAMAAGITLDHSIKLFGTKGATRTKQVLGVLNELGIRSKGNRLTRNYHGIPDYALVKVRFKDASQKSGWNKMTHWVLRWDKEWYDPDAPVVGMDGWLEQARVSSYVELIPGKVIHE